MEKSIGYFRDLINSNPKVLRIPVFIKKRDMIKVVFPDLRGVLEIELFELLIQDMQL